MKTKSRNGARLGSTAAVLAAIIGCAGNIDGGGDTPEEREPAPGGAPSRPGAPPAGRPDTPGGAPAGPMGGPPAATAGPLAPAAMHRLTADSVRADARRLEARLGAADRRRLGEHLEGIRAIEGRLQAAPAASTCAKVPGRPTVAPATDLGHEDLEGVNKAMADLVAVALACDLTRAFSLAFSQMQSDTVFWQAGFNEGLHTVTHRSSSGDQCHKTVVFTMQQLAYLVGKLKATPEGAGNLLDSLCLYGCSEIAEGYSHSVSDVPMLVIGRAGGALRSGVHYRSKTKENTNKVLLAMLKAVDVPVTSFGAGSG
jgi:hypothetical protein